MRGKHRVIVKNNKLHYEFEIKRNITIIQGDSATGKTTLIEMINQYQNLGMSSGIELICDVPCRTLAGTDWKMILSSVHENIKTHKYSLGFLTILELRLCFLKIIIFAL